MVIQNCEQWDYIGDSKENLETHICECHATEESVKDEDEDVEHNFSEVYERFVSGKDRFIVTSVSMFKNAKQ